MDPRDRPSSFAAGVECAACGRLVPQDRIRVLARREDLAFVELTCPGCRSESLGIVVDGQPLLAPAVDEPPDGSFAIAPTVLFGEFNAADDVRFRAASPIGWSDVEAVSRLLRDGGLDAITGGASEPPASGSTP